MATREQILKRYPNANERFIQRVIDADSARVRPTAPKPVGRVPLDAEGGAKEAHWYNAAKRFEVTYTVYSVRPADYDGYDIKALQDFLVKAGILTDDRWDVLAGRVVSRKAATEEEERTEIQIRAFDS